MRVLYYIACAVGESARDIIILQVHLLRHVCLTLMAGGGGGKMPVQYLKNVG